MKTPSEHPLFALFFTNPKRSALSVTALFFASLGEMLGASTFFALISTIGGISNSAPNAYATFIHQKIGQISTLPVFESLLILIVIGFVLKNIMLLVANRYIRYSAIDLQTRLRVDVLSAVMSSKWNYLIQHHSGKFMNVMSNEIGRTGTAYTALMATISLAITSLAYIILSITISWYATLFSLGTIGLAVFLLRRLMVISEQAGDQEGALNQSLLTHLSDTLQAVKLYKVMAKEHLAQSLLETQTRELNQALRKGALSNAILKSIQEPLFVVAIVIALLVTFRGVGLPMVAILTLAIMMFRILVCVGRMQNEYSLAVNAVNGFVLTQDLISQTLSHAEEPHAGIKPELNQGVELHDVSFSHLNVKTDTQQLKQVSMFVPTKQLTVLVGVSGAGKTTIIDLIAGLHSPKSGKITVDGVNLDQLDLKAWRKMIGYVAQESLMLDDTVLHNLTLGDVQFTMNDVVEALQKTGAYEFVQSLPQGIETPLGERGSSISGGQRQRLMIARALLHHPQILILDEATASLDPEHAHNICETLLELRGKLSILMISHQPEITRFADRIYRIDQGVVSLIDQHNDQTLSKTQA